MYTIYKVEGERPDGSYIDGLEFLYEQDALRECSSLSWEFPENDYWIVEEQHND